MFLGKSSFIPTLTSSGDHFSWKFIQSLPLTKKQLVLFINLLSIFASLPLLYTFMMSYSYLIKTEVFASLKDLDLLKITVNYFLVIYLLSLSSIDTLISYPRVEYRKKNNKSIIPFVETVLIICVIFVYFALLSLYTHKQFNINLTKHVLYYINQVAIFSTTWWFPPVIILSIIWKFKHTLNLWSNEKSGYEKERNGKNKWNKIAVCCVLLVVPFSYVDLQTPAFYRGSLINKAVYNKKHSEIDRLISEKQSINQANSYGFTPMFVAIHEGDLKTMKYLEARGATYEGLVSKDTNGHEGFNALLLAIDGSSREVVDYVLTKGFDINAENIQVGFTPIQFAAKKCNSEILDLLINKGADLNLKNKIGQTAALVAVKNKCLSGSVTLKEAGARFDIADNDGKKIIDYIKVYNNSEFKYVIDKYTRVPAALK